MTHDPISRRRFMQTAAAAGMGILGGGLMARAADLAEKAAAGAGAAKYNVLFLCADDIRPQLGCYGDPLIHSPNLDALAGRGMVFNRAYCQQGLCSPSRISLMTGRHPWTTGIYEIGGQQTVRKNLPNVVTLPQHFKNNGWHARSLGKVYHVGIDDPQSWSVPSWSSSVPRYGPIGAVKIEALVAAQTKNKPELREKLRGNPGEAIRSGPVFESPDVDDEALMDGDIAREAMAALRELAKKPEQPFFLATGFMNPHVPWVAPKRYHDLYDSAAIQLPKNPGGLKGAPSYAATTGDDFHQYANVPKVINKEFGRQCLHSYYASISYVDACVGRVLAELDRLKLRENTIVVFWGDHGLYMGEHSWWGSKHNTYEGATHATLIVSAPGMKAAGKKTDAVVEFVDIYPSLIELGHLPPPADAAGLEGQSFVPLLNDPKAAWNKPAFSEYPKSTNLGTAMRTDRYRYVEWKDRQTGKLVDRELYDYETDPLESENVARKPENAKVLEGLAQQFQAAWRTGKKG